MDVGEPWVCRVHSSSPSASMQQAVGLSEGDDDMLEFFPCPFCYVEVEVLVLCNHLQEEHCFDMKNAVCPLCAAILGKDTIGHFVLQHSHMLKIRKTQRKGLSNDCTAMVENEPREFGHFRGVASTDRRNATDSAPDPLLSPFICSIYFPVTKEPDCEADARVASTSLHVKSSELSMANKVSVQDYEETSLRAEFLQQVLISTMF